MVELLSLWTEILKSKDKETDKQSDTTDMYELKREESDDQEGKGLKILTPSQMISRLTIALA